jgi:hypothetical protein
MNKLTDDPLVSRDVSRRQIEAATLKNQQQKQMESRLVATPQNAWNQSIAASNDDYMKSALEQVRESDVTLNQNLTRFHGTWFHNQKQ